MAEIYFQFVLEQHLNYYREYVKWGSLLLTVYGSDAGGQESTWDCAKFKSAVFKTLRDEMMKGRKELQQIKTVTEITVLDYSVAFNVEHAYKVAYTQEQADLLKATIHEKFDLFIKGPNGTKPVKVTLKKTSHPECKLD